MISLINENQTNWFTISQQSNIPKDFVEKFKHKLILREVFKHNKYSSKFLKEFIFPTREHSLVFGIGNVDITIFLKYQNLSLKLIKLIYKKFQYDIEIMKLIFQYQKLNLKFLKKLNLTYFDIDNLSRNINKNVQQFSKRLLKRFLNSNRKRIHKT